MTARNKKQTLPPSVHFKAPKKLGKTAPRHKKNAPILPLPEGEQFTDAKGKFKWNEERGNVAIIQAEGYTVKETAKMAGVSERTIKAWRANDEFMAEVDRLSVMVGLASRGERMRIAQRIARTLMKRGKPTRKDLLDWLKFAQSETDGTKLNLTSLFEAAQSMAGSGQEGTDTTERDGQ